MSCRSPVFFLLLGFCALVPGFGLEAKEGAGDRLGLKFEFGHKFVFFARGDSSIHSDLQGADEHWSLGKIRLEGEGIRHQGDCSGGYVRGEGSQQIDQSRRGRTKTDDAHWDSWD
ncbi:hypothetical protein FB451DRAFT_1191892 [Mycena latifolia]|nr:hypothetical protein FB451DRAFT_1191892 [Mycena latifolia]